MGGKEVQGGGDLCILMVDSENEDHGIWSHHFMGNRWGKRQTLFFWAPKSLQMVTAAMKLKDAGSLEGKL